MNQEIPSALSSIGKLLSGVLQKEGAIYFITVFFLFLLLYAIYSAVLRFVYVFQNDQKHLTHAGRVAAVSLSGLSVLSMMMFTDTRGGMRALLEKYLVLFGNLGGLLLASVVFLLVSGLFSTEDGKHSWRWSLIAGEVSIIFYGRLTDSWMTGLGVFLLLITAVSSLFRGKEVDSKKEAGVYREYDERRNLDRGRQMTEYHSESSPPRRSFSR